MYLGIYPTTTTTVTTHIIVTTNLLTLSNVELESAIESELAENPALERVEQGRCPRCGAVMDRPPCQACLEVLLAGRGVSIDVAHSSAGSGSISNSDYDPLQMVVQPTRLADHVLAQLHPQLTEDEEDIACFLVEALDERGFLSIGEEQVAEMLGVSVEAVERVLYKMQLVDPVGVGSRSPQECLLRQLESLPDSAAAPAIGNLRPVAQQVLDEHWDSFLHAKWGEIPVPSHTLAAAIEFIRSNLTPYPALADWQGEMTRRRGPADASVFRRPDMRFYYDGDGNLAVEMFSTGPKWLRLSQSFQAMMRSANGNDQDQWREMAERARLFIKCLGQRHQTLRRVVDALVSYQDKAIRLGDSHVRPLTRTQLAQELDLHEATVSRAIMGKTAVLPDNRIVPLAHFFESGKSVKEIIRQMVAAEDEPLSDSAIAGQLATMGHSVARRTVAKYRNLQGILPVHLRVRQKVRIAQ